MNQNEEIKKGNVLTSAQIAGIQAVKNTSSIIPLCHPLNLTGIEIDFENGVSWRIYVIMSIEFIRLTH